MITTLNTRKLLSFAGIFALAAIALVFPFDAFATSVSTDVANQAKTLAAQASNVPKLMAVGAYIIGTFFAIKALFALKGFIEAPDDNPVTKAVSYGAVAALMILLPYIIGVMRNTIGANKDNQDSAASQFAQNLDTTGGF